MPRRAPGEGWSVTRDADGYRTGYTDSMGRRRHIRAKTAKEAREKRDKAVAESKLGVIAPPHRTTVEAFLTRYLDDVIEPRLSRRTVERYRGIVSKHIVPEIGRLPLSKLTSEHIQRLYARKGSELAPASVRYVHAVLRGALQQAVTYRLLPVNPASGVKAPRKPRRQVRALGPGEARALLEAVKDDPLEALYVTALHTGMRLGELLALTWGKVDWSRGSIEVSATLHRLGPRQFAPMPPKTPHSRRSLTMNSVVTEALRQHRVKEGKRLLGMGLGMDDDSLIFTDRFGDPIYWARVTERHLHPLCDKAGIPHVRFHDLRHTAASMMLSNGVPVHVVSEILGHSSPNVTLSTYAHVLPGDSHEAVRVLERVLGAAG